MQRQVRKAGFVFKSPVQVYNDLREVLPCTPANFESFHVWKIDLIYYLLTSWFCKRPCHDFSLYSVSDLLAAYIGHNAKAL